MSSVITNLTQENTMNMFAQILQGTMETSARIKEIQNHADLVYAREGDDLYDEVIDINEDGKITYDEYIEYCEENAGTYMSLPGKTIFKKIKAHNTEASMLQPINMKNVVKAYTEGSSETLKLKLKVLPRVLY